MVDPSFEARLRTRIHEVLDREDGPHPIWADAPARMTPDRRRPGRGPIRLLGIAALLAIGGGVLSLAGSWRPAPDTTPPSIPSAPVIPAVLGGQFRAQLSVGQEAGNPYPFYFVDLEDPVLLHGPGDSDDPTQLRAEPGTSADWAGRIVEFTPVGAGAANVLIRAPAPCGDGRYLVRYDEVERRGSAEPWNLWFIPVLDPCARRVGILAGGSDGPLTAPTASPDGSNLPSPDPTTRTWSHQPVKLVAGRQYSSWSFTEPFHFQMPIAPQPQYPATYAWTWLAPGTLHLGGAWWSSRFYDDLTLPTCDRALADIPSTPAEFESWLRSTGRSIDRSAVLEVDGRTAVRYDTSDPSSDCPGRESDRFFGRWYLIPSRDDTILFTLYGDTETEVQYADDIVRSMTFD